MSGGDLIPKGLSSFSRVPAILPQPRRRLQEGVCSQTPSSPPPSRFTEHRGSRTGQVPGELWETGLLIGVRLLWPSASQVLAEPAEGVLRDWGVVPNLPSLLPRTLVALASLPVSLQLSLFPQSPVAGV